MRKYGYYFFRRPSIAPNGYGNSKPLVRPPHYVIPNNDIPPIEVINTDDNLENNFCQCSDQIGFPILCSCQFGNKVQTYT